MIFRIKARHTVHDHPVWYAQPSATDLNEVAAVCDHAFRQGAEAVEVYTPNAAGTLYVSVEHGVEKRTGIFAEEPAHAH